VTVSTTATAIDPVDGTPPTVVFSVTFEFLLETDLRVYLKNKTTGIATLQLLATHYSVSGGAGSTGDVTFVTAPPTTDEVHIIRDTAKTQPVDLTNSTKLPSAPVEEALDRTTMLAQETTAGTARSIVVPDTDTPGLNLTLPDALTRAGQLVQFDSSGNVVTADAANDSSGNVTSTGSTTPRTHAQRWAERRNVLDFGAVGDGVTDDSAEIQAAIDAAEADGGGTVYFPAGVYLIGTKLTVTQPVRLLGAGYGERATAEDGSAVRTTTLKWDAGAGSNDMIFFGAGSTNLLIGAAVTGIMFDGSGVATRAIYATSVAMCDFDVVARSMISAVLEIDGGNSDPSTDNRIWVEYATTTTPSSTSVLVLDGEQGAAVRDNTIFRVSGVHDDGDMIRLDGNCSRNVIHQVSAVRLGGGTGFAVNFKNNTRGDANRNVVLACDGHVNAESRTYGNRIVHIDSSASSVTLAAGAQLHYDAQENNSVGRRWNTKSYKMRDEIFAAGSYQGGAASFIKMTSLVYGLGLDDTSAEEVGANLFPSDWADGDITEVKVWYAMAGANTTKQVRLQLLLTLVTDGEAVATADKDVSESVSVPDAAVTTDVFSFALGGSIPYTKDSMIGLIVARDPAHGDDDAVGDIVIMGMSVVYEADGPVAGAWNQPADA